jgi:hypothetical protein
MNNSNINQTTTSQDIQNLTEGEILGRGGNLNDLRERLQHVLNAEGDYHLPIISNTGDRDAFAALNDRLTIDQRKTLIIMLLNNTHYITILKFILNKLDNDYLENFLSLSEVDNTFYTTNNFMNLIS